MIFVANDPVFAPTSFSVEGPVITISGELDLATSVDLLESIVEVARSSPSQVVVDLTDVTFMDSAALDAIDTAHSRVPDCQIVLRSPSSWIRKLLVLTHMESVCTF
jgi:anti-anti-sigma factor